MAFCSKSSFNRFVTAMTPSWLVADFKHWLGIMNDEEYARWLNEPEQKKLWEQCQHEPSYNNNTGPGVPNEQPKRAAAPLAYDPSICELPSDMMFMHERVFAEGEKVPDIDLTFKEYKDNWWDEIEADRNISCRGKTKDRVQDYLDNSEKVEYVYG